MKMPKYDNGAFGNIRAFGTFVKETVRTEGLKIQIRKRKSAVAAIQRMQSGQANTTKNSSGMASGVSKKEKY